jgi:RNA polymerase sigma-70 factor, ECF subfamily
VLARPRLLRSEDDLGYLLRALRNTFLVRKGTEAAPAAHRAVLGGLEPVSRSSPEHELETREVFAAIAGLPSDFATYWSPSTSRGSPTARRRAHFGSPKGR